MNKSRLRILQKARAPGRREQIVAILTKSRMSGIILKILKEWTGIPRDLPDLCGED